MSVYPFEIDTDAELPRVDDDITETGGEAINATRTAIFAIETELGITPSGSLSSVADRLDVSLNSDGSIKSSALTSIGLATLPITNNQVASSAGIQEFKLILDHSTSNLNTLITSNSALLNSLVTFTNSTDSNLSTHIGGGAILSDGSAGRHVASHIDINVTPSDPRDISFTWAGLFNKDGNQRSATDVATALQQINDDFVAHQNAVSEAHLASAITLDTSNFEALPLTVDTTQKLADYLDDFQVITVGQHVATQHANGIPLIARSQGCNLDGYKQNVVPSTSVSTYLVRSPNTTPVDDISVGDNIIKFSPDNTGFVFDSQFSQVQTGDIITVNYGTGFEASFIIDSLRFVPGSEWIVRINGINLSDSDGYALARIDRPSFDRRTEGVLALASANATPTGSFNTFLSSVIVGNPRGAMAFGLGFDPGQLDASHYNLYIELYPTGNPSDRVISLPAVDVTGDFGTTVGSYTLDGVVQNINNKFREIGFNFRFIAFSEKGNVGIMMADAIDCASFAIIKGSNSTGTLIGGIYSNNIIGEASGTDFDALGLGAAHANVSSPAFISSFSDATAAQIPTKVIVPLKNRDVVVNGVRFDTFNPTWNENEDANGDGYWDGYISARTEVGSFTVETTYTINLDLKAAGLKAGKTIVIQPKVEFSDSTYFDVDYGRFIIKSVNFVPPCPGDPDNTQITVISGVHGVGTGFSFSSDAGLPVRVYFSSDSVSFDSEQVINQTPTSDDYHRSHEIYINDEGRTFSHERARMLVQSGGGSLLGSGNWHVDFVSPKLRGYKDDSITFNKFIRFYVLEYDTVSGEFDGYIGKRSSTTSNILNVGPITRGRKNVSTRFYDESNLDYVDLTFTELATTVASASDILGGGIAPRYVDIELFDSLTQHDEIFLIGTAEVNWDPVSGQAIIQRVVNRREFGSVDEEDFTQSAIDFINAGDRALHENGIIRGFDFDFINTTDNREIFYKGGSALVNGSIVVLNAISVTIPELLLETDSTPATVNWVVCVNKKGKLEPIVVTPSKSQFFAEDNVSTNTYYVPSVTFLELVENRKDLTPIAIVTANIASVTISDSDHLDVRRFIDNGIKRELVFSPTDFSGTFHTSSALVNWVNNYGSTNALKVKVRGSFDIASSLDFTGLTSPLELDGDGAIFNITATRGLLIKDNITIKNIILNYNPSELITYISSDIINVDNGCIYLADGSDSANITIENCVFNSSIAGQRPAFIALERDRGDVIQELTIKGNNFNDSSSSAEVMAAIAIVTNNTGVSVEPAVLYKCRIEDNTCDRLQGIWITQFGDSSTGDILEPGITVFDTRISGNNCGAIGFITTSVDSSLAVLANIDRHNGLIIESNNSNVIGNYVNYPTGATNEGTLAALENEFTDMASGSVTIRNNDTNFIWFNNTDNDDATGYFSRKIITDNRISAPNYLTLDKFINTGFFSFLSQVPGITSGHGGGDLGEVIITGNYLTAGRFDSINYLFNTGIFVSSGANVANNIIRGLNTSSLGIKASDSGIDPKRINIIGNDIARGAVSIGRFISLSSNDAIISGIVTDNIFDSTTIDGGDTELISDFSISAWIIERNKNQTKSIRLSAGAGAWTLGTSTRLAIGDDSLLASTASANIAVYLGDPTSAWVSVFYNSAASDRNPAWHFNISDVVPIGAHIVSVTASVDSSVNFSTADFTLAIKGAGLTTVTTGATSITTVNQNLTVTTGSTDFWVDSTSRVGLLLSGTINDAGAGAVFINSIDIVYRW